LDDDYDEIRRQLWLATDSAYKQALDDWAKKKAALENRVRTEDSLDFSKEPASVAEQPGAPVALKLADAEKMVRELSGAFRGVAGIDYSAARLTAATTTTRFLSTEGTRFTRVDPLVRVVVSADGQATDGMTLADSESFAARSVAELPPREKMMAAIGALQKRLVALREARPLEKRYTGPVLFEGQAAAELIGQTLAPAFVGVPRLVTDNQMFANVFGSDSGGMRDKLGSRILPAWIDMTDDATAGGPFLGGYQMDDDGVPSRANLVVERGVFKQLLNSRALVAGAERSTGSRRAVGAMPSNVFVKASQATPAAEMEAKLLAMVKERGLEYGVIVRRIANATAPKPSGNVRVFSVTIGGPGSASGGGYTLEPVIEAVKIFADGRKELIQGATINGMTLSTFRDVVAASDTPFVYTNAYRNNRQSPLMGGPLVLGTPLVSFSVPSLLFDEISLQRPVGEAPKLPYSTHPSFTRN
jgi:predicted Zn-dependent protease